MKWYRSGLTCLLNYYEIKVVATLVQ
uniref:Uncharacterized protein n=1 Tax=Rhizophora mucronata TaxID=61149 RepID=A0A2P2PL17_RHIMU